MQNGEYFGLSTGLGADHMALDTALLSEVATGQRRDPVLRFYTWDTPTLSLGFHQSAEVVTGIASQLPWVRRPTGGRAVLHGAGMDLTYAVIWRPPSGSRQQVYDQICQFLVAGIAPWQISLSLGRSQDYQRHISCFTSHTAADLTWHGYKVVGSAQVWRQGVVLQHGTILLQPDRSLWEAVFPGSGNDIQGLAEIVAQQDWIVPSLDLATLCHHLSTAAERTFSCTWAEGVPVDKIPENL